MTAKVTYTGELRTLASHVRSGSEIETDAPVDNHGKGERFSPTDLVAVALATCILTTLGILGKPHNLVIDGAECDVEKIMVGNPRRIGEIKIEMRFPKNKSFTEKEQKLIEHIAHTCPVFESLHPECKKTIVFMWPS
ncbi:MAG: OsmC family protein [Bacteroidota bacterium]